MSKEFQISIHVKRKDMFPDPLEKKLLKDIQANGFTDVKSVKIGKLFHIKEHAESISNAFGDAHKITDVFLANKVYEEKGEISVQSVDSDKK